MTQYTYIASPIKLPQGTYGLNPISPEQPNIYESELDFAHLYFENNYDEQIKRKFSYSTHFTLKYQVATTSNHLPLKFEKIKSTEGKCLNILYSYIDEAIQNSGIIEYYSSINGHEDLDIAEKREVRWEEVKTPYDLILEDREFWVITL